MERIIIKGREHTDKGALKVFYNGNRTASVAPWLKEIQDAISKVGIGGSIEVVVEKKGDYNNITDCKLDSGLPGTATKVANEVITADKLSDYSPKDRMIVAQTLTKAWAQCNTGLTATTPEMVLEVYKKFLESL